MDILEKLFHLYNELWLAVSLLRLWRKAIVVAFRKEGRTHLSL